MRDVLKEICDHKRMEIKASIQKVGLDKLRIAAEKDISTRSFIKALESKKPNPAIIAEVKKKSPSKGIIRADFNHIEIAKAYEAEGAACISVLTDEKYFAGSDEYFKDIRKNIQIPMIRKDFMLEPYQIYESRVLGADCILLIMAALELEKAKELEKIAHSLNMDVLIEIHDEEELENALKLKSKLVGVNNRNLKTMEVSLENGKRLSKMIPDNYIKVCESGINTNSEIKDMMQAGFNAFLVGESLMKQKDIAAAVRKLLNG